MGAAHTDKILTTLEARLQEQLQLLSSSTYSYRPNMTWLTLLPGLRIGLQLQS